MKLDKTARALLGLTALAWSIPYAQAADARQPGVLSAQVKTALLREKGIDSLDVSVETFDRRVLLSGFVADETQRRKALLVAAGVQGVTDVKDGLAIRR